MWPLVALALAACLTPPGPAETPRPTATPVPTPTPTPLVGVPPPSCGPVARATFAAPLASAGYVGYLTCAGTSRNAGAVTIAAVEIWLDQLDASGKTLGTCQVPTPGPLAVGATTDWKAVCPVTSSYASIRVRVTREDGGPITTEAPR